MVESRPCAVGYKSNGCWSLKCEFYVNGRKKVARFSIYHAKCFVWYLMEKAVENFLQGLFA